MGKIFVIASGKGGTGKSVSCAVIGAALARSGKSVLLVDCDTQIRGLDFLLGVTSDLVFDIWDIFSGSCDPIKAVYPIEGIKGLSFLPAPDAMEKLLPRQKLVRLIKGISDYFDYIILDSPSGLSEGFSNAAAPADSAIIVTTPDTISARAAFHASQRLKKQGTDEIRLIINRYDSRLIDQSAIPDLDYIIDTSGIRLLGVVPEDISLMCSAQKGLAAKTVKSPAFDAFLRISARISGEDIPVLMKS